MIRYYTLLLDDMLQSSAVGKKIFLQETDD